MVAGWAFVAGLSGSEAHPESTKLQTASNSTKRISQSYHTGQIGSQQDP